MGTFKLHISCTQAMCSLQYRLHMQHAKDIYRGAASRPPYMYAQNAAYVACTVGCTWLVCSLCVAYAQLQSAHMWPLYIAYILYIHICSPRLCLRNMHTFIPYAHMMTMTK